MLQDKKCKLCRREGKKLFLKGERCLGPKCSIIRRSYAPGMPGKNVHPKLSDYAIQLRAKQTAKKIYKINENSLKRYYQKAAKSKKSTGEKLLQFLILRLDSIVYQLGITSSRNQARQLIKHGHILVNTKKVDIPSYQININNKIEVVKNKKNIINNTKKQSDLPTWLKLSKDKTQGEIIKIPTKDEITTDINIELVIEFYSR